MEFVQTGPVAPIDLEKMAVVFAQNDLMFGPTVRVGRIDPVKVAVVNSGDLATDGRTVRVGDPTIGTIIDPIVFPIAIAGIIGAETIALTSGTTGITTGITMRIGITAIGGIGITFAGRTSTTSTSGARLRGRR